MRDDPARETSTAPTVMCVHSIQRWATHAKRFGQGRRDVRYPLNSWMVVVPTSNWQAAQIAAIGQNMIHKAPTGSNSSSDRVQRQANRMQRSRIGTSHIVVISVQSRPCASDCGAGNHEANHRERNRLSFRPLERSSSRFLASLDLRSICPADRSVRAFLLASFLRASGPLFPSAQPTRATDNRDVAGDSFGQEVRERCQMSCTPAPSLP